ncbi:MAG: TetR/AcrR family transcriptional regulator [Elusimicrobiota bacterium]|nr:MAG: TetR/AcrR family transcriptional regulator [Elusimicrobiota bacterium]
MLTFGHGRRHPQGQDDPQRRRPPSKRAILNAALKLFVSNGYDATTIRDIAAEARYTNPALFKYFDSKEALGVYLFERAYRELLTKFETDFEKEGPTKAVLLQWMRTYVELLSDDLESVLFVHDHLSLFWPKVASRFGNRTLFGVLRAWLVKGRAEGRIGTAVPLELQIAAVSGFFHQFALMIKLEELDARRKESTIQGGAEILAAMLKPDSAPRRRRKP